MVRTGRFIYGTVEECVNEIWKMIDFEKKTFPDFDYCETPYYSENLKEDLARATEGGQVGESWYGCKANYDFNPEFTSINLIFGYYGGGCFDSMMIYDNDEEYKKIIIDKICETADLHPDWETIFELI